MSKCTQKSITDAAFVHLKGIHTLDMSGCTQDTITDAALMQLQGITKLNLIGCHQITIVGALKLGMLASSTLTRVDFSRDKIYTR
jgi:hypothetical protein